MLTRKMSASGHMIIFTDLDGTLLHPSTYSFEAARPALRLAAARGVPVVFCSSKTRSEVEGLRLACGNTDPFVFENGGGIVVPEAAVSFHGRGLSPGGREVIALGRPYRELRAALVGLRERLGIPVVGFGDLSADEVSALTGLPPQQAELARHRDFDEPFFFPPGERGIERFLRAVEDQGLRWTQGGRFYHVHGDNDKGRAVGILTRLFAAVAESPVTVGLGDSLNDLPMLEVVERPVLIPREDGSYDERIRLPRLERAAGVGPEGWNEVVLRLLGAS